MDESHFTGIPLIPIIVIVVAVLVILAFSASRIKKVGINEALIIIGQKGGADQKSKPIRTPRFDDSGKPVLDANGAQVFDEVALDTKNQKVVIGQRAFIWPIVNETQRISLEQYQHGFSVQGPDVNYINTNVDVAIQFRVGGDPDSVRRAAQLFQSTQKNLANIIAAAIEGHVRSIIGELTFREITSDRARFKGLVVKSISADFAEQGIIIDTLNIKDVTTPGSNYLANLGAAETAKAQQEAAVAQSEAFRASEFARIESEERVAERDKALALKKASIKSETDRAQAEADASGQLAKANQDRLIAEQERQALAEQALVEQERLEISIRKPAEAAAYAKVQDANAQRDSANAAAESEAFRRKTVAEANKSAAVLDAEASAATVTLAAEAQRSSANAVTEAEAYRRETIAEANKKAALLDAEATASSVTLTADADAAATNARGLAEAAITRAAGLAEAESIKAQAQAMESYGNAATSIEVIKRLPEIAQSIAGAFAGIDNFTVISKDGASAVGQQITDIASDVPALVKNLTGFDVTSVLAGMAGGAAASTVLKDDRATSS